jgi:hypothetical protein
MSHVTSAQSSAKEQLRAHLATAVAAALIILAVVAGVLALGEGDGAAGTTPAAETGTARFEGYEAGIAAAVRAQSATGEDETRVAAAIAGK